jgi:hypothetical protein
MQGRMAGDKLTEVMVDTRLLNRAGIALHCVHCPKLLAEGARSVGVCCVLGWWGQSFLLYCQLSSQSVAGFGTWLHLLEGVRTSSFLQGY